MAKKGKNCEKRLKLAKKCDFLAIFEKVQKKILILP
jgi:hypothetical protein|tara:strand:- start:7 stop:114 length:108 start_codon:yes stop_codon:yes gene_type:complete